MADARSLTGQGLPAIEGRGRTWFAVCNRMRGCDRPERDGRSGTVDGTGMRS